MPRGSLNPPRSAPHPHASNNVYLSISQVKKVKSIIYFSAIMVLPKVKKKSIHSCSQSLRSSPKYNYYNTRRRHDVTNFKQNGEEQARKTTITNERINGKKQNRRLVACASLSLYPFSRNARRQQNTPTCSPSLHSPATKQLEKQARHDYSCSPSIFKSHNEQRCVQP